MCVCRYRLDHSTNPHTRSIGKALLARHREVNAALAEELKAIHAITLKCLTPAQWEEKQKQA